MAKCKPIRNIGACSIKRETREQFEQRLDGAVKCGLLEEDEKEWGLRGFDHCEKTGEGRMVLNFEKHYVEQDFKLINGELYLVPAYVKTTGGLYFTDI